MGEPKAGVDGLDQARESVRRQEWGTAYAQLSAADHESPLEPVDLELLAMSAYLTGRDDDGAVQAARAYRGLVDRGDRPRAARCAFWLAFHLLLRGEVTRGGGWLARAARLLEDGAPDCVERGYLLVPAALQSLDEGDPAAALATATRAVETAERFADADLEVLGRLCTGQALVHLGETAAGVGHLDEVMVAVTAREVSPIVAGIAYCAVIEACHELFDVRRAREWTVALTRWCEAQPDLVPYRGQCLVHRAEIMQMHGAWPDALDEAERACARLSDPPGQPAAGLAFYQLGDLHRLRGEFDEATESYRQAGRWMRDPQPGLALLLLAQGQIEPAAAAIRRAVSSTGDRVARCRLLGPYAEIMAAAGDLESARAAAGELRILADDLDSAWLRATVAAVTGSLLLADGDAPAALDALRAAWAAWQDLDAPYEAARTRVGMALGYRRLRDEHAAAMELDAARWIFRQLGAAPDIARVERLARGTGAGAAGGLTGREVQVLRLVAAGKTNRAIANELFLSEKTVARHLSNILGKLGVTSRAAATAYAYQNGLIRPPT